MGELRPAIWYDEYYRSATELKASWRDVTWKPLYEWACSKLTEMDNVIDLGCGCGHFAQACRELVGCAYRGVDFSAVAIEEARIKAHGEEFFVGDILSSVLPADYTVAVALEVVEHLSEKILPRIRSSAFVVLSVPTFDAPSHVKHFEKQEEVEAYFKGRLYDFKVERIESWWGVSGVTR